MSAMKMVVSTLTDSS